MSPREVHGLQALAMAHGGSLTINPHTGLPEAGFLSSILPLVAGAGLTAMGMPAGMAALTVGGGTAMATGSLGKGLMAGIGAYGGAGLAESLIGSGAAGLAPETAAAAANAVPTETAAQIANSAAPQAASAASGYTRISPTDAFATTSGPPSAYQSIDAMKAAEAVQAAGPQTVTSMPEMYTKGAYLPNSAATMSPANMTAGQRFDALKAGATGQNLLNYAKANPLQTAGMLAGPLMAASEGNNAPSTPVGDSDRGAMANAGYEYDPGWSSPMPSPDPFGREQRYNQPRYYIPKKAADGGAVQHFDAGGTIDGSNQTPALNKFLELQAARVTNPAPAPAPTQIDVKQQFADYLKAQSVPLTSTTPIPATPTTTPTTTPAVLDNSDPNTVMPEFSSVGPGSHGLSGEQRDEKNDPNSWANQTPEAKAQYYGDHPGMGLFVRFGQSVVGLTPLGQLQQKTMPGFYEGEKALTYGISPKSGLSYVTPAPSTTGTPSTPSSPAVQYNVNQPGLFDGMDRGSYRDNGGMGVNLGGYSNSLTQSNDREGGSQAANGGLLDSHYAHGGGISSMYNLGSYSDGGRLLRGPGDGVSDSIPATIGHKQPARLADGEFVIPARIVSEIGNGSTEAGARKLYAMMDKVQKARRATVGKGKVAKNTRADKYLPA